MSTDPHKSAHRRGVESLVASPPGSWFYVNVAPHIDRPLQRLTGGRVGFAGKNSGVLNVRGARSGAERRTPLMFTRDGENLVVVASRGGDTKHPAWYHNVVANPEVTFSIRGEERPYRARVAADEERSRLWTLVNRNYSGYETYQERAGHRVIPIVVLEPV